MTKSETFENLIYSIDIPENTPEPIIWDEEEFTEDDYLDDNQEVRAEDRPW